MSQASASAELPAASVIQVYDQLPDDFEGYGQEVTILFADLVGSTAFKQRHSSIDGVRRTYQHNHAICRHIKANGGAVVKNIGDAVMAQFLGEAQQANAIRAALQAVKYFEDQKQATQSSCPIETKIGVHAGRVWFIRHAEDGVADPLGLDVDLAARVQHLANPQQVVCTASTFALAEGHLDPQDPDLPFSVGPTCQRFVKGVENHIDVHLIQPSMKELPPAGEVSWVGHSRSTPEHLEPLLEDAGKEMRAGTPKGWQGAFEVLFKVLFGYETADGRSVAGDEYNFRANWQIASMILRERLSKRFLEEHGISDPLMFAFSSLCRAKQTRPDYARVWLGLGWIRFKWAERGRTVTVKDCVEVPAEHWTRAIENTQKALTDAMARVDLDAVALAQIQLADLLWRSSPVCDLSKAQEHCRAAERYLHTVLEADRLKFRVTRAMITMAEGNSSAEDVRRILVPDENERCADGREVKKHSIIMRALAEVQERVEQGELLA